MAVDIDPEGVETGVLRRMVNFTDKSVLEVGCGDGRMTKRFALSARYVHAIDTDPSVISSARAIISSERRTPQGWVDPPGLPTVGS